MVVRPAAVSQMPRVATPIAIESATTKTKPAMLMEPRSSVGLSHRYVNVEPSLKFAMVAGLDAALLGNSVVPVQMWTLMVNVMRSTEFVDPTLAAMAFRLAVQRVNCRSPMVSAGLVAACGQKIARRTASKTVTASMHRCAAPMDAPMTTHVVHAAP